MNQYRTLCIIALASVAFAAENVVVDNSRIEIYSSMCNRVQETHLLADPFDCAQFIQCDYGQAFVKKCSPGLKYDSRLQVCNWENQVQCDASSPGIPQTDGPVRCYGYDTLHFIADTRDCEKYFICANGIPYPHQCAPGINWDYLNNQCESPSKAQCAGKGDNNQPEETSSELPAPVTEAAPVTTVTVAVTEPVNEIPDCSTGQQFFGCQDSCAEYFVCVSSIAYRMKCPDGYFWNEDSVKCDIPELSRCIHPQL